MAFLSDHELAATGLSTYIHTAHLQGLWGDVKDENSFRKRYPADSIFQTPHLH